MKFVARSLLALAILAVLVTGALGWHVAGRIRNEALLPSHDRATRVRYDDAVVLNVDSNSVTLELRVNERGRAGRAGTWGLLWAGGGGRVDSILARGDGTVTRRFTPIEGRLDPGTYVDARFEPYTGDPRAALGLEFHSVEMPSELGRPLPAWEIPGPRDVWAICVHGKGAGRVQMLREAEHYSRRGYSVLIPSYRNDWDAPASPDSLYHYGLTEWHDLESAVRYAQERGSRSIVLHGISMGGGIVIAFLQRSRLASVVSAGVLDSPMLDFGATIDWGIERARIPGLNAPIPPVASALGKSIVAWRDGVDWDALDLLKGIDSIRVPLLVLHGDDDGMVPAATSRSLAERLPDRVTLVGFPGAEHGEAWNVDRGRYDRALDAFLRSAIP